jgi:predicted PurR-regulated permease PerM
MVIKKIQKIAANAKQKYSEIIATKETKPAPKLVIPTKTKKKIEKRLIKITPADVAKSVAVIILMIALSALIFQIKDILMLFFVSLLFSAALDPTIDQLERHKIPRSISAIVIFVVLITLFSFFMVSFIPILANQLLDLGSKTQLLIGNIIQGKIALPAYLDWLNPILKDLFVGTDTTNFTLNLQNYFIQFGEELRSLAGNALLAIKTLSNGLANAILVLLLTYFMIVDENIIDNFIIKLFPSKYESYINQKSNIIKFKVGQWLRGQMALMLAVGILTYIGLVIIGIEYAFTLALFAGLTELIPVIGPLIGWVAAIPIAANQSMSALIWVTILYFVIQRLENNLLVPIIMKQATGLHPIIVLFAMLVGFEFYGVIGVIISVPVSAVIGIFIEDYLNKRK